MKTGIRLNSIVRGGVGGSDAHAIEVIYIALLSMYGQQFYRHIGIIQIDENDEELILKESSKSIHCNIRYPVQDFEKKSFNERNKIRVDIITEALTRISKYEDKIDIEKIQLIRKEILERNFSFDITCYTYPSYKGMSAKLILKPDKYFSFFVDIEKNEKTCRIPLFKGRSVVFFGGDFFAKGKWINSNEMIIQGKSKEVEFRIIIDKCAVEMINLTRYANPPWLILMKADATEEERAKAGKDHNHSLPPHIAAIIRRADN